MASDRRPPASKGKRQNEALSDIVHRYQRRLRAGSCSGCPGTALFPPSLFRYWPRGDYLGPIDVRPLA
eukprot:3153665-Alexandrium_andersonii.AAC.1